MPADIPTDIINQFMQQYLKEQDYYISVCALAQRQLQSILDQSGIRAMVTARAKAPDRLEAKLRQRYTKAHYACYEDIYSDIVDFAGVRVALYFPKDLDKVDSLIREHFNCTQYKDFPSGQPKATAYVKRFSGYRARHFHVTLKSDSIAKTEEHYSSAHIEIQVASVLMHAWSEVEHDLAYKPLQGELSTTEYAILDELNGLVMAGEIALERLQDAMAIRVSAPTNEFSNSYELASYLANNVQGALEGEDQLFGDVRTLLQFLVATKLNTPHKLKPSLTSVDIEKDNRTIAQQIIDQIISSDKKRREIYWSIVKRNRALKFTEESHEDGLNELRAKFLESWIALETMLRKKLTSTKQSKSYNSSMSAVNEFLKNQFSPKEVQDYINVRKLRNEIVHGVSSTDTSLTRAQLLSATTTIDLLIEKVKEKL